MTYQLKRIKLVNGVEVVEYTYPTKHTDELKAKNKARSLQAWYTKTYKHATYRVIVKPTDPKPNLQFQEIHRIYEYDKTGRFIGLIDDITNLPEDHTWFTQSFFVLTSGSNPGTEIYPD